MWPRVPGGREAINYPKPLFDAVTHVEISSMRSRISCNPTFCSNGDRLKIDLRIAPEVTEALVPYMCLQPLAASRAGGLDRCLVCAGDVSRVVP